MATIKDLTGIVEVYEAYLEEENSPRQDAIWDMAYTEATDAFGQENAGDILFATRMLVRHREGLDFEETARLVNDFLQLGAYDPDEPETPEEKTEREREERWREADYRLAVAGW